MDIGVLYLSLRIGWDHHVQSWGPPSPCMEDFANVSEQMTLIDLKA